MTLPPGDQTYYAPEIETMPRAELEEMQLDPAAKNAATILQSKHPQIEFTSGRRSIFQQAHAMANNVAVNRKWIGQTVR